jgi:hypothetical protein
VREPANRRVATAGASVAESVKDRLPAAGPGSRPGFAVGPGPIDGAGD